MLSLFDMLSSAQNGNALDQFASQFGLSQTQAQQAVEALLPAFSQGLKRNAATPTDLGAFLTALSSGQHAKYFDDAARAFAPAGMADGNGILGHLFGSKEVSRAVAAQAAQASGVGQEVLKQMLPALAAMIMGGLYKQTTGEMRGADTTGNPIAEIMKQMMAAGGMRMPHPEAPQPGANPFDNPFLKSLNEMFSGATGSPSTTGGRSDNPFERMMEQMTGGVSGRKAEPPKSNPSGRPTNPYDDLFGGMFETGARARDDYQKSMGDIFDRFLKGMEKRGS